MKPRLSQLELKYILSTNFFLFCFLFVQAQDILISGTVLDENTKPLDYVILVLKNGSSIIDYKETDSTGLFAVTLDRLEVADTLNISFMNLSYMQKDTQLVISSNTDSIYSFVVHMRPKHLLLEGVVISENQYRIKNRGDTVTFNANQYTDSTEITVSDLLAKLPGVEVSNTGEIKVNGRSIDKVLVDGEDLFDKQYKVLTENLNAEHVEEIDILFNYLTNPLYKDFIETDKIALNLRLTKRARNRLIGSLELELGTPEKIHSQLNLGRFGGTLKVFSSSSFNNLGIDSRYIINEESAISVEDLLTRNAWRTKTNSPFYRLDDLYNLSISNQYFIDNKTTTISTGVNYKPSDNTRITARLMYVTDSLSQSLSSNQLYNLPSQPILLSEDIAQNKKINLIGGNILLQTNFGSTKTLEYRADFRNNNDVSLNNYRLNDQKYFSLIDVSPTIHDHQLKYTNKISSSTLLTFHTYMISESGDQMIETEFLTLPDSTVNQNIQSNNQLFGATGNLLYKKDNINLNLSVIHEEDRDNVSLFTKGVEEVNSLGLLTQESLFLQKQKSLISTSVDYRLSNLKIRAANNVIFLNAQLRNDDSISEFYLAPEFRVSYKLKWLGTLSTSYSYEIDLPDIRNYLSAGIYLDYRTVYSGDPSQQYVPLRRHRLAFKQSFNNWKKEYLINTSLNYITYNSSWNQEVSVEAGRVFTRYNLSQPTSILIGNVSFITYLRVLKGTINLSYNKINQNSISVIDSRLFINNNNSDEVKLKLNTQLGLFTNNTSTSYQFINNTNGVDGVQSNSLYTALLIKTEFSYFTSNKKWKGTFSAERFRNNVPQSPSRYFMSLALSNRVKRINGIITLSVNNLFNVDNYEIILNSTLTSSNYDYRLNGRFILLKYRYII